VNPPAPWVTPRHTDAMPPSPMASSSSYLPAIHEGSLQTRSVMGSLGGKNFRCLRYNQPPVRYNVGREAARQCIRSTNARVSPSSR
jgi:hypothetical protein